MGAGALPDPILTDVFAGGPGSSCNSDLTDSFNTAQITVGGGLKPQSVNNVTDEDPPVIDRGSVNGRVGFDQQVHDPRGRVWYVRLLHSF